MKIPKFALKFISKDAAKNLYNTVVNGFKNIPENVGRRFISNNKYREMLGPNEAIAAYKGAVKNYENLKKPDSRISLKISLLIEKKVNLQFNLKSPQSKESKIELKKELSNVNKTLDEQLAKVSSEDKAAAKELEQYYIKENKYYINLLREEDFYKPILELLLKRGKLVLAGLGTSAIAIPGIIGLASWFGGNDDVLALVANLSNKKSVKNTKSLNTTQPTDSTATTQPTDSTATTQPADSTATTQPADSTATTQPADNMSVNNLGIVPIYNNNFPDNKNIENNLGLTDFSDQYIIDGNGLIWINVSKNLDGTYDYSGNPNNKRYAEYIIEYDKDNTNPNIGSGNLTENHKDLENDPIKGSAMYNFIVSKLIDKGFITNKNQLNMNTVKLIQKNLNSILNSLDSSVRIKEDGILGPNTYKMIIAALEAGYNYDDLMR